MTGHTGNDGNSDNNGSKQFLPIMIFVQIMGVLRTFGMIRMMGHSLWNSTSKIFVKVQQRYLVSLRILSGIYAPSCGGEKNDAFGQHFGKFEKTSRRYLVCLCILSGMDALSCGVVYTFGD